MERRARTGGGPVVIAANILLIIATIASALFCYYSITAPDGRIDVTLTCDGRTVRHRIWPCTVFQFLDANGITIREHDSFSAELDDVLADGDALVLERAFPVAVSSPVGIKVLSVTEGTVGDALALSNVICDADDELSHLPFADLTPGMKISYATVDIEYTSSDKTLQFQEEVIKDDTLYEDKRTVEVEGKNGIKQVTQRITVKNGIEVSREIVDQVVIEPAIDEVIRVGTKIKYQTNYTGETRRYKEPPTEGKNGWKAMYVECTAYCSGTRTSQGTKPNLGTIAVNPSIIPYGTQIWIKGYGYGKALDTGAFRHYEGGTKNQLDLWFNSEKEAKRWGRKYNFKVLVKMG